MKRNILFSLLMVVVMLVVACSSLPPLVSLESSVSTPQMVTIYEAPT